MNDFKVYSAPSYIPAGADPYDTENIDCAFFQRKLLNDPDILNQNNILSELLESHLRKCSGCLTALYSEIT